MTEKICVLVLAAGAAFTDMKGRKVRNGWLLFWAAAGMLVCAAEGKFISAPAGVLLPIVLLGWTFRLGKMGAGDIKLFCVCGLWMGGAKILYCMFYAFAAAVVYGGICLCVKRGIREGLETKLPMAVFVFVSAVLYAAGVY